jgi:hypothetical protein
MDDTSDHRKDPYHGAILANYRIAARRFAWDRSITGTVNEDCTR